jgi:hypothetical protein
MNPVQSSPYQRQFTIPEKWAILFQQSPATDARDSRARIIDHTLPKLPNSFRVNL